MDDAPEDEPGSLRGKIVVLIVDDHADTRDLVGEFLRWRGHYPITARNAAHARTLIAGVRIHAVVTDFAMPDEDGVTFAQWVRRDLRTRNTPVVLYSGQADDRVARQIEQLGGRVLRKPAELEQIAVAIESLVRDASAA